MNRRATKHQGDRLQAALQNSELGGGLAGSKGAGGTAMSTTATIRTSPRTIAATYTFTLLFPGDQIAMLEVRGAANQDMARTIAQQAVRHRQRINLSGNQIEAPMNYTV